MKEYETWEVIQSIVKEIIEEEKNGAEKVKKDDSLCWKCRKKLKKDTLFSIEIYTVSKYGETFSSRILLDSEDLKEAIIRKLNRQYAENETT